MCRRHIERYVIAGCLKSGCLYAVGELSRSGCRPRIVACSMYVGGVCSNIRGCACVCLCACDIGSTFVPVLHLLTIYVSFQRSGQHAETGAPKQAMTNARQCRGTCHSCRRGLLQCVCVCVWVRECANMHESMAVWLVLHVRRQRLRAQDMQV